MQLPFIRCRCEAAGSEDELVHHLKLAKVKWTKMASRMDAILRSNGGVYLVGKSLSYADVLVAHMTTWFIEEVRPPPRPPCVAKRLTSVLTSVYCI